MKISRTLDMGVWALAFVLIAGPGASRAEAEAREAVRKTATTASGSVTAEVSGETQVEAARRTPVYSPPRRGRPRARVGGGVRGIGPKLPTLRALVPDHVALTARDQPVLLWSVSDIPPEEATLLFTLTSEDEIDPLIRAEIERPIRAGLQRIEMAAYDFRLETGKEYEWSVALVPDQDSRARDLVTLGWIERVDGVAQGWIERIDESADASNTLSNAAALAEAGLWYDAVSIADPEERAALLDQVGLSATDPH